MVMSSSSGFTKQLEFAKLILLNNQTMKERKSTDHATSRGRRRQESNPRLVHTAQQAIAEYLLYQLDQQSLNIEQAHAKCVPVFRIIFIMQTLRKTRFHVEIPYLMQKSLLWARSSHSLELNPVLLVLGIEGP